MQSALLARYLRRLDHSRPFGDLAADQITEFPQCAPRGTPPEIVERLNREIVKVLADPETRGRLRALGAKVRGGTLREFRDLVSREIAKWAGVIEAAQVPRQ